MSTKNSIQVAIKVRPLLRKEKDTTVCWRVKENSIQLTDSTTDPYIFDHIFDQDTTNEKIFDVMAKHIVHAAVKGFNGTIFAYGQTSSGKTYTMLGDDLNPGVMVLAAKEIFKEIERTSDRQFLLRVGYIEIYNEKIYDLFNKKNADLKIHDTAAGVTVNCEEIVIYSEQDILRQLVLGNKDRTVGETNMNERSSRSHAIFRIIIESRKMDHSEDDTVTQSVLNLVDLAGSERADQTGATGVRLKEGGHINKSLLFLSNVIKRLSENDEYVSYRDSKLTRILQASLGGNALTSIICTITPSVIEETQSTLNFAMRAKDIKNKPHVNEIVSDSTMMKRLEREIKVLKERLDDERNKSKKKMGEIEQDLKQQVLKFITSNSINTMRPQNEKRRRTWGPTNIPQLEKNSTPTTSNATNSAGRCPILQTPLITMREEESLKPTLPVIRTVPEVEESFIPAELCNFEISPSKFNNAASRAEYMRTLSLTPKSGVSVEQIENALYELQEFTKLEKETDVDHELYKSLKQQLDNLIERNNELEKERLTYLPIKDELNDTKQRCADLQTKVDELQVENQNLVGLDFEFERLQNKSKLREKELLELLEERNKEVAQLKKLLEKSTQNNLLNTECNNCTNLQSIINENSVKLNELSKLSLEYGELQMSYKQAKVDAINAQNELVLLREAQINQEAQSVQLEKEVISLRLEIEGLQAECRTVYIEKDSKATLCEELETKIVIAENKLADLQSRYNNLEILWEKQEITINKLQAEYESIQTKYNKLQEEYKISEQLAAGNEEEYNRLLEMNNSLQQEIRDLRLKVTDVQQNLLLDNASIKDSEELKLKLTNLQQKYVHLQQQHEFLQTEYNDLSNQLMDTIQEGELLRNQNTEMAIKINEMNVHKESISKLENIKEEILDDNEEDEVKFSNTKFIQFGSISSMSIKSSGIGSVDDNDAELLQSFYEHLETVRELEFITVNEKPSITFMLKNVNNNNGSHNKKLLLFNAQSIVNLTENEMYSNLENICLQGAMKNLMFHIVDLKQESDTKLNEYNLNSELEEYKRLYADLREEYESLLESTKTNITEMREEIERLSKELLEKTLCIKELEESGCFERSTVGSEDLQSKTKRRSTLGFMRELHEVSINRLCNNGNKDKDFQLQNYAIDNQYVSNQTNYSSEDKQNQENTLYMKENEFQQVFQDRVLFDINTQLRSDKQDLFNKMAGLEVENKESENQSVNSDLESLNSEKDELKNKLQSKEKEFDETEKETIQLKTDFEKLKLEKEVLETQIREYKENKEKILCELETVKNDIDNLTIKNKELHTEIHEIEEMKSGLVKELESTKQNFEDIKGELHRKEKEVDDLKEERIQLQTDFEILELEKEKLENQISENEELVKKLESAEEELKNIRGEKEELLNKLHSKEMDVSELKEERIQLQSEYVKEDKQTGATQVDSFQEEIEKLRKEVSEVMSLRLDNLNMKNMMEDLHRENLTHKKEIEELLVKQEESENKLGLLKESSETEDLKAKISELEEINKTLLEREEQLMGDIEKKNRKILELEENITKEKEELVIKLHEKSNKYDNLKECFEATELACNKLEEDLKNAENSLVHQKEELMEEFQKLQAKIIEEKKELAVKLQEKTNEYNNLQTDFKISKIECNKLEEGLKNEKNALVHQMEELTEEFQKLQENTAKEKEELVKKEKEKSNELKKLQKDFDATKLACNKLKEDLKNAKYALVDQKEELTEELNKKTAELQKLQENTAKEKEELVKKEKEKSKELKKLQEDFDATKLAYNKLKEDLVNDKNTWVQHQDKLTEELNNKNVELQEVRKKLEKVELVKEELIEKNRLLQENYEKFCTEKETCVEKLVKEKQKLTITIEELKETHKQELILKEKELETKAMENRNLNENLKSLRNEINAAYQKTANYEQIKLELGKQIQLVLNLEKERQELQQKSNSLEKSISDLQIKYVECQEELKNIQGKYTSLQQKEKELQRTFEIEKYLRCEIAEKSQDHKKDMATNREELRHKEELYVQLKNSYDKQCSQLNELKVERSKLEDINMSLLRERTNLQERIYELELFVKKTEVAAKRLDAQINISMEDNISPKTRKSLGSNENSFKENALIKRKSRRLSTHDDNRRQVLWHTSSDVDSQTDPFVLVPNCKCTELELKLKEKEKELLICRSREAAIELELRNHPLKDKNAELIERLKKEQKRHQNEEKKLKAIIVEKTKYKPLPVINVCTQTDENDNETVDKLKNKCTELRNICQKHLLTIESLEAQIAQKENVNTNMSAESAEELATLKEKCKSLQSELIDIQAKYVDAKKVLSMRRQEIEKLKNQLETLQTQKST